MENYDIAIIGAGPAGANLARLLPKNIRAVIIDGSLGREKVCGGLISPDAKELLDCYGIALTDEILASPQLTGVRTMDLSDGYERFYKRGYINVKRSAFDAAILSLVGENVKKLSGRCVGIEKANDGFYVSLEGTEKIFCSYLVGADGGGSFVRRSLFKDKRIHKYIAIQQWFEAKEDAPHYACVFDSDTSPACSWIFFKDGRLVFGGAFNMEGGRAAFEKQKEKLVKLGKVSHDAFDAPLYTEACTVCRPKLSGGIFFGKGRAFLIGEASGLISPSSFEGISYALKSGELLAKAFEKEKAPEAILGSYKKSCFKLKLKLYAKCVKRPFMYSPLLRRAVMKLGIG